MNITLFTSPKPFTNPHIAAIQRNAIQSWRKLPGVEILLMGEEDGLEETAHTLGVRLLPHVRRNERGTPLVSSMLELARQHGSGELLCVINADMILLPDFISAAQRVSVLQHDQPFVMLSQRWDYDQTAALDFSDGWEARLKSAARTQGKLHKPAGSDFFLFPRACYPSIPDFAIGRAGWDNWMIYWARRKKYAVIDCTPALTLIHQNHDYAHLKDSRPHYDHPESRANTQMAGGQASIRYTILDSTRELADGRLTRPKMSAARWERRAELFLRAVFFFLPEKRLEALVRPKRWKKRLLALMGKER